MKNYNTLKEKTELFTDAFYATTLPAEVVEAVAANPVSYTHLDVYKRQVIYIII